MTSSVFDYQYENGRRYHAFREGNAAAVNVASFFFLLFFPSFFLSFLPDRHPWIRELVSWLHVTN